MPSRGEAKGLRRIAMAGLLRGRLLLEPLTHPCGHRRRQLHSETIIDSGDHAQRIGVEFVKIDVMEALGESRAKRHGPLHGHTPFRHLHRAETLGLRILAPHRHPVQHVEHAAQRRSRGRRVAVSLNDQCIGKHLEQQVRMPGVSGILQKPALVRIGETDEAQNVGIAPIGAALAGFHQPLGIGRSGKPRREHVAHEALLQDLHALVDDMRRLLVGAGELRRFLVEALRLRLAHLKFGVAFPFVDGRAHHRRPCEPTLQSLKLRIDRQQLMQCRGAAAWNSRDDERPYRHRLIGGIFPKALLGVQAGLEHADEVHEGQFAPRG